MATRTQSDVQPVSIQTQGWNGGVNIRDVVSQLQPNEMKTSENGTLDEGGGWSKRLGCISNGTFGSSGDRILSMYTFYRGQSAVPQVIIHTTAGIMYYTNDASANPVVWTTLASGLSTSARYSFETFIGKVWMS